MTEANGELPAWTEGSATPDTVDLRKQAKVALQVVANYFHDFAQPPAAPNQRDGPFRSVQNRNPADEAVEQLRRIFDPPTAQAVSTWAVEVHDLLFERSEEVIRSRPPTPYLSGDVPR